MEYLENQEAWPLNEEELKGRSVPYFTFYDVVLDFILMDSFDDLAHPPASALAVAQNRFLSDGFKETVHNHSYHFSVLSVFQFKGFLLGFCVRGKNNFKMKLFTP